MGRGENLRTRLCKCNDRSIATPLPPTGDKRCVVRERGDGGERAGVRVCVGGGGGGGGKKRHPEDQAV